MIISRYALSSVIILMKTASIFAAAILVAGAIAPASALASYGYTMNSYTYPQPVSYGYSQPSYSYPSIPAYGYSAPSYSYSNKGNISQYLNRVNYGTYGFGGYSTVRR
jgi:hypothetical protein